MKADRTLDLDPGKKSNPYTVPAPSPAVRERPSITPSHSARNYRVGSVGAGHFCDGDGPACRTWALANLRQETLFDALCCMLIYWTTPMNILPTSVHDRWLSVDELAGYLGIKRDTVYKWITRRNMPAHKVGRLWKFRKEEIDAWVRSGAASDRTNRQCRRRV